VVKWEQLLYLDQTHKKLLYLDQKIKNCCKEPKTFLMVSRVHGLTTWSHDNLSKKFMVSKMQKKCVWAEMYQNDGLPWIYPTLHSQRQQEHFSDIDSMLLRIWPTNGKGNVF